MSNYTSRYIPSRNEDIWYPKDLYKTINNSSNADQQ